MNGIVFRRAGELLVWEWLDQEPPLLDGYILPLDSIEEPALFPRDEEPDHTHRPEPEAAS